MIIFLITSDIFIITSDIFKPNGKNAEKKSRFFT